MSIETGFLIMHLFGVAIGAGGAYVTDWALLTSLRDHKLTKDEFMIIHRSGLLVFFGLALLVASGIGLFSLDPSGYLASTKFIAKMVIVAVLTVNGFILHGLVLPLLKKHLHTHLLKNDKFKPYIPRLLFVGSVSFASWTSALILGAIPSVDLAVWQILAIYIGLIACALAAGLFAYRVKMR